MEMDKGKLVQFRLKGNKRSEILRLTHGQYLNLKDVAVVERCEIDPHKEYTVTKQNFKEVYQRIMESIKKEYAT